MGRVNNDVMYFGILSEPDLKTKTPLLYANCCCKLRIFKFLNLSSRLSVGDGRMSFTERLINDGSCFLIASEISREKK